MAAFLARLKPCKLRPSEAPHAVSHAHGHRTAPVVYRGIYKFVGDGDPVVGWHVLDGVEKMVASGKQSAVLARGVSAS